MFLKTVGPHVKCMSSIFLENVTICLQDKTKVFAKLTPVGVNNQHAYDSWEKYPQRLIRITWGLYTRVERF